MPYDIRWDFLSDSDAKRIYKDFPKLAKAPNDYCPTCNKKGTYFFNGQDNECDCQMQTQLCKHYLRAGVGDNYQRLDWPDFFDTESLNYIKGREYVEKHELFVPRGIGLVFHGRYGVGKTLAANLIIKDLVKLGYRCFATTFANMVDQFTAGWKSVEEQRLFHDRFVGSDVVLLDDLGKEFRSSSKLPATTFDNLLRSRVQAGRPTILTTNLDIYELKDGYGDAALSLLLEKLIRVDTPRGVEDSRPMVMKRSIDEAETGITRPIF